MTPKKTQQTKTERLEALRKETAKHRLAERELDLKQRNAQDAEQAASELLVRALTSSHGEAEARAALTDAKLAAHEPWTELKEAQRRLILQAQRAEQTYIEKNINDLLEDLRPEADKATAAVHAALSAVTSTLKEWDRIAANAYQLRRTISPVAAQSPNHGLDEVANQVRRALQATTIRHPIDGATPSTQVVQFPSITLPSVTHSDDDGVVDLAPPAA